MVVVCGGEMAFHKDAVTFSSIITCSLLSPAFARRRIPAPPRRKRSAGKISQELHHGPRGTCSSGGESRASRSVDTNPHHKNVLVEGGGQRQPGTSFCRVIISPPAPWVPAEGTDRRTFCWEAKRGGYDVKVWKSLRAGGKKSAFRSRKGRQSCTAARYASFAESTFRGVTALARCSFLSGVGFLMAREAGHSNNSSISWNQPKTRLDIAVVAFCGSTHGCMMREGVEHEEHPPHWGCCWRRKQNVPSRCTREDSFAPER